MWKCYIPIIGIYFARKEMLAGNDGFDVHFLPTAIIHSGSLTYIAWLIV